MDKTRPVLYVAILIFGLAISAFIIKGDFSPQILTALVFCLIFIPTLISPDIGLIILIVSMLFFSEIVAGMTTRRAVTIRSDDILLMAVSFAWLLRTAFTKDIGAALRTEITKPYLGYITACIFSTLMAMLFSSIDTGHSFLCILKYLEYFILFVMVRDNLKSIRQAKIYIAVFLLTALMVSINAQSSIQRAVELGEHFFRIAPPMDPLGAGESGSLGGYLLFMMAIAGGFLLYSRSLPLTVFLIALEVMMFRGLLYTLSRGSYLALAGMAVAFFFFARRGRIVIIYVLAVIVLITVIFMPNMIRERITTTAIAVEDPTGMRRIVWEESPQARLESWGTIIRERFPSSPFFGHGVGKFFIDSQPFLTLNEAGLFGLIMLIWLLSALYRAAGNVYRMDAIIDNNFSLSLTTGFMVGFIGLILNSISANIFIIISIMEAFWFMASIVLSLPRLVEQERASDALA